MRSEPLEARAGDRLFSASADRNAGAVAAVLKRVLPERGVVLEVSSGTGQHIVRFAAEMPHLIWQPSERDDDCLGSIARWIEADALVNLRPPLRLDVTDEAWPIDAAAALVCLNMIHIAPWSAAQALMRGAGALLDADGTLVLYGPYRRGGVHTSPSNEAFDDDLKARDPRWGVRNIEDVARCAEAHGLDHLQTIDMPANNLSLVFKKR